MSGARAVARRFRALGAAILLAAPAAIGAEGAPSPADSSPQAPAPARVELCPRVELSAGTDGAAAAVFLGREGGRLSAGIRAGLGYEWADFLWDDPSAALALRWRLLGSRRWAWWLGAEAGLSRIDSGYDRFLVPTVAAVAGGSFRFGDRLSATLEAGGRYGRRDLAAQAALDFLTVRYEETYFIDPFLFRLGFAFDL